jgi:hypothetical protein
MCRAISSGRRALALQGARARGENAISPGDEDSGAITLRNKKNKHGEAVAAAALVAAAFCFVSEWIAVERLDPYLRAGET